MTVTVETASAETAAPGQPRRRILLDEGFPRRVLRVSLILIAIGVLYACRLGAWRVAIGLGFGGLVGGAAFLGLALAVHALVRNTTTSRRAKTGVVVLTLVKFPLLGVALWFALYRYDAHPLALLAGLAMTQVVMVLKLAGLAVTSRQAPPAKAEPQGR
jgi:hypothetical protein